MILKYYEVFCVLLVLQASSCLSQEVKQIFGGPRVTVERKAPESPLVPEKEKEEEKGEEQDKEPPPTEQPAQPEEAAGQGQDINGAPADGSSSVPALDVPRGQDIKVNKGEVENLTPYDIETGLLDNPNQADEATNFKTLSTVSDEQFRAIKNALSDFFSAGKEVVRVVASATNAFREALANSASKAAGRVLNRLNEILGMATTQLSALQAASAESLKELKKPINSALNDFTKASVRLGGETLRSAQRVYNLLRQLNVLLDLSISAVQLGFDLRNVSEDTIDKAYQARAEEISETYGKSQPYHLARERELSNLRNTRWTAIERFRMLTQLKRQYANLK